MLAIVILNFNNCKDTIECLKSIKCLKYKKFKVFLGDNSTKIDEYLKLKKFIENNDDIRNFVELYRIHENKGFGAGNNYLLKKIDTKQYKDILLLNNDTIIKSNDIIDVIYQKIKFINNNKYIIGCKLLNIDGSIQESRGYYPGIKNEIIYSMNIRRLSNKYDYLSGAFLFFNSNFLKEVGMFDEDFFLYFEEVDLIYRASKKGYKLYYIEDSIVIHKGGQSTGGLNEFTVKNFLKSMNLFISKNLKYKNRKYILYFLRNMLYVMNICIIKFLSLIKIKRFTNMSDRVNWCLMNIKNSHLIIK